MAGVSGKAATFGLPENKFKYNGQILELDHNWSVYQMKWRIMDPQTGRFIQLDPLSQEYFYNSTFAYAENRPIMGPDVEGLELVLGTSGIFAFGNSSTIARVPIAESLVKTGEVAAKSGEKLPKIEEHHLIPRSLKNDPISSSARKGGFKYEGKENKMPVEKFTKETGKGQHGNHPNYSAEVARRFAEFKKDNPKFNPEQAAEFLRNSAQDLKQSIRNNPETKINDLFKILIQPAAKDGIIQGLPNKIIIREGKKEEKSENSNLMDTNA